jgi:hypothetical protein
MFQENTYFNNQYCTDLSVIVNEETPDEYRCGETRGYYVNLIISSFISATI